MLAFTADNHIGITSQWSLKERKDDFMSAFHNVVESIAAHKDKDKSLIIGGDLFDTAYPPSFAVEFVQSEIRRLAQSGCAVFGIDGNHDVADGKWLRVCGITPLSCEPAIVCRECGLKACGIGYRRASEILDALNSMADRGVRCDILVLHIAFGELNRMGAASDLSSKELLPILKKLGVRRVLMGHIHIRQEIEIDGITFSYCGSTELCSINEPKSKSFDIIDPFTMISYETPIATREVSHVVVGNEHEFAAYENSVNDGATALQSVYVSPDIEDGVRRLRALAKSKHLMMRIQVVHRNDEAVQEVGAPIDRSTGVIGLEQAIGLRFRADSEEAELIRAVLRSPETLKLTVDNYMHKEQP